MWKNLVFGSSASDGRAFKVSFHTSAFGFGAFAMGRDTFAFRRKFCASKSPSTPWENVGLLGKISASGEWPIAEASPSYPWCREFKSPFRYFMNTS